MLDRIVKKRTQVFALILLLSVLLAAATVLAATKSVRANRGGEIKIARGVKFVVPPDALQEDTVISVDMVGEKNRICFYFGPDGTTFDPPAELRITWQAVINMDVDDPILYGENGEEIIPQIKKWEAVWYVPHFSLYYFRRR